MDSLLLSSVRDRIRLQIRESTDTISDADLEKLMQQVYYSFIQNSEYDELLQTVSIATATNPFFLPSDFCKARKVEYVDVTTTMRHELSNKALEPMSLNRVIGKANWYFTLMPALNSSNQCPKMQVGPDFSAADSINLEYYGYGAATWVMTSEFRPISGVETYIKMVLQQLQIVENRDPNAIMVTAKVGESLKPTNPTQ